MAEFKAKEMMNMVGNSLVQLVRLPVKIGAGCADAAETYATKIDRRLAGIEAAMPERPTVLVTSGLGMVADTLGLIGDVVVPVANAVNSTAKGISDQVERIKI